MKAKVAKIKAREAGLGQGLGWTVWVDAKIRAGADMTKRKKI